MPFPWQPTGALAGGVPNQMSGSTPQNNEGLGVWGKAMFNLPRFQMPGTDVRIGGDFGVPGSVGPGSQYALGGVNFNINRTASSDPVQNIIGSIQNPLGGMSMQVAPQPQTPLKQQMTGLNGLNTGPVGGPQGFPGTRPNNLSPESQTNTPQDWLNWSGRGPGADPFGLQMGLGVNPGQAWGSPGFSPFGLRSRMMGAPFA